MATCLRIFGHVLTPSLAVGILTACCEIVAYLLLKFRLKVHLLDDRCRLRERSQPYFAAISISA
jgi:hypothetical protein